MSDGCSNGPPIVVGLGELLWDCFPDRRLPGGAPANVAFHACQLGCQGIVCSRVGCDGLGDELVAFLERQGLRTAWIQRDPDHPTGTVSVDIARPELPRFTIHEHVAWDYLSFDPPVAELLSQAAAVCFGTLAQRSAVSRQTIQQAIRSVRPECLVVYDVNLRQRFYERDWVEASLRAARLVKLNAEEVVELNRLLALDAPSQEGFARALLDRFALEAVCVTRGEHGCLLVTRDESAVAPGQPVDVVDTVGSGDAFTAAWIWARLCRWSVAAQARFANAVGALVATQPGAMPILTEPLRQLVAQYRP